MGISIGFGIGPIRVSSRLRGPRLGGGGGRRRRPLSARQQRLLAAERERRFQDRLARIDRATARLQRSSAKMRAKNEARFDAMSADQLRKRLMLGWILASVFAAACFVTLYLAPFGLIILGGTWYGHRKIHQRRAAKRATEQAVEVSSVSPMQEARRAEELGLPESAKAWRALADQQIADARTMRLPHVSA